ncbi:MAG: sugar-transfer associated ATP-grasp domain-containing protein [Pseudomonadota bacterium]
MQLDQLVARLKGYREWVQLAEAQTGKGLLVQAREILTLKQYGGQCGISDYYWYKLYDNTYQQGRGAPDFLGWRLQQQFSLALNPRHAVLPAWDKISFIQLASSAGLPVAPVRACFHKAKRLPEVFGRHLRTQEETAKLLRNPAIYPLFAKPAYSQQGYGSAYLAGYDPISDSLTLLDGKSISIESFLHRLEHPVDHRYHRPQCGFVFQEPFKLAPEIQSLTGWPAICGVRIICLSDSNGVVKPIRAVWKIAVPPNHVDNFSLGKYGNLLADVNLETGEICRVIDGFWPKTKLLQNHPHTGESFADFKLPGWTKILEACQLGGAVFPLMKIHHWDFALTDKGPVILELNDLGATEMLQVHGHGLLTRETREFLRRHTNTTSHPWVKRL